MIDSAAYIRRETAISIVINMVLSAFAFLILFGWGDPVQVWGMGHYMFDFGPQAFMIALMSTLVPGAMAGRALRAGKVEFWSGRSRLPRRLSWRALLLASLSPVVALAGSAALLTLAGSEVLPFYPAFAAKLAFGAALALIVTPAGLRAALVRPA